MNERDLVRRLMNDADKVEDDIFEDFNQNRPRKMKVVKERGNFKGRRTKPIWKRQEDGE
jgi:hypothetical protein